MDIHKSINWMSREEVVNLLEGACIQCYDHETDEELREALVENIQDGTIQLPEQFWQD